MIIQVKYANLSRGAVFTELTLIFLQNLTMVVPSIKMQSTFDELIDRVEKQKELVEASIRELQTLLDSRMDYWFN